MDQKHFRSLLLAVVSLTACGRAIEPETRAVVDVPRRTSAVRGLVAARPFSLAEPYVHRWRLEQPSVRAGWLLVLAVDPAWVEPRQTAMPVLLLGDQTVECVNFGQDSGRVIAIVPEPLLDLAASPAWFGPPELPERVDAAWIRAARARTRPEDVTTFTAGEIAAARARGGDPLQVASRVELDRQAALWILEHSPSERELAEGLLVPVTK